MRYTKEQRLDIDRRIYNGELTKYEAAKQYDISHSTARDYMRMYRDENRLPPKRGPLLFKEKNLIRQRTEPEPYNLEVYKSMSKDELIQELIKVRVILELSGEIPVKILCKVMGINRSSFYYMILHSDQGSVYASKAYNELMPMYVNRSMSRAGTPTDNAAMESINGWIKAELFMDLHVTGENQ